MLACGVVTALAVIAAGCGGRSVAPGVAQVSSSSTTTRSKGGTTPGSASTAGSKAETAPRFSACMRAHGVPNFPDPTSGGAISITSSMGINPQSPRLQAAQTICQKLLPGPSAASPAQQANALAQALRFSACMRSHGLPDFPDPKSSGGGFGLTISKSSGIDPSSPAFETAQKACGKESPGSAGSARTSGSAAS
jgi:hypothetical protein